MITVVEFYKPWFYEYDEPRPKGYTNRNAAIEDAAYWAYQIAVDRHGTFKCIHVNNDKDMEFTVQYDNNLGAHCDRVALMFDIEIEH